MSFLSLLNKTASILAKQEAQQPNGEILLTWVVASTAKTRYEQASNPKITNADFITTIDDYLFFFPIDTVIDRTNRISIENNTFEVTGVFINEGLKNNHHLEVYARIISNE